MSDEHLDPQQDPEQEERVRALLADLDPRRRRVDATRGGGPARRDPRRACRRARGQTAADVVPLRRRWAPRAAAVAAAVIVMGRWRRRGQPRGLQRQRERHRLHRGQLGRWREQPDGVAGRRREHGSTQQSFSSTACPGRAAASRHRRVVRQRRGAAGAAALAGPGQRRQPAQVRAGRGVRPGRRHRLSRTEHRRRLHDHPGAVRRHPGCPPRPPCPGGRASRRGVVLRRRPRARQRPGPRLPHAIGQSSPGDPGLGSPSPTP